VTAVADKKCRQAVRRARREFEKLGIDGIVAVCGCWAQGLGADEAKCLGIDILVGNRLKNLLPDALEMVVLSGKKFLDMRQDLSVGRLWDALSLEFPLFHTRAFLKVQEGCDHFCSYCVIPFLRGRSTSRPLEDALSEAAKAAAHGCKEVVLTGIHLGMYGRDIGSSLAELVQKMSSVPGVSRLRLGSLEPFALDGELLDALARSPLFCRHLHLPMQSGDDKILAGMKRGHGADDFARVCELAREALGGDDLHISSDVLVAFPGEDEAAFRKTLALMEKVRLGRVHVFPYSPRKGTAAAAFPGRVAPEAASARAAEAIALGESLLTRYSSRFVGRDLSILVEDNAENNVEDNIMQEVNGRRILAGYTKNFVKAVVMSESAVEAGQEVEARMTGCCKGELRGVTG
jgi:threonylcarbamoyladenosine tRNA methylthiotransferase MtaB